jgi:hypothetical protein
MRKLRDVVMGSPVSHVVVDLYMEWFEKRSIETHPIKPKLGNIFVDDAYTIWSHGREILDRFKFHLSSPVDRIKFIMEITNNNNIPFLYILISKKNDG